MAPLVAIGLILTVLGLVTTMSERFSLWVIRHTWRRPLFQSQEPATDEEREGHADTVGVARWIISASLIVIGTAQVAIALTA